MALIAINSGPGRGPADPAQEAGLDRILGRALDRNLDRALAVLPERGTPLIMVHGFRFSPSVAGQSPHEHILSFTPDPTCWKAVSWPRLLGLTPSGADLGIAFGWEARGSLWAAYAEAARAGADLARLIDRIALRAPGRAVGIIAHSLGARVALQALTRIRTPIATRLILLSAAEFRSPAAEAFAAARGAELINVTTRANHAFDTMLRAAMPFAGATLGGGLPGEGRHWLDLPLDRAGTLDALAGLGHPLPGPATRVCHWNAYLRPGVFDLYRAVLEGALPLATLRRALPAPTRPRAPRSLPLPGAENAPV